MPDLYIEILYCHNNINNIKLTIIIITIPVVRYIIRAISSLHVCRDLGLLCFVAENGNV